LIAYLLIATGFVVQTLKKVGVNYLHIFELDYRQKMTEVQLWKAGLIILMI